MWYFDSDATQQDMFSSLKLAPACNIVICAYNSTYLVKGDVNIVRVAANGSTLTFLDAFYVPGIKKNLLSNSTLAKVGLVVKFVDDRCTIHDLSDGDVTIASSSLCCSLYKLESYDKCVNDAAYSILDMQAMSAPKLWNARFRHLNFSSLLHLH